MANGAFNDFALGKFSGVPKSPQEAASRLTGGAIPAKGPLKKTSGGARKRGIDRLTSKYQPGQEMAEGSPQANYEERRSRIDPATGEPIPLSGEEVLQAKRFARENGMTFNANIGYRPATVQGQANAQGNSQGNWREQNMAAESDFNKVKTSKFVPADVRAIQAMGGPRNAKEAKRMAQFQSSTAGQRIAAGGGFSGGRAQAERSPTRPETDSRGQAMVSGGRGKEYAANLGSAWGNAFDQQEARAEAIKQGEARLEKVRKTGKLSARAKAAIQSPKIDPSVTASTFKAKKGGRGTDLPSFEIVEGKKDGGERIYGGKYARMLANGNAPKTAKKKEEKYS